jgi:hypothetical protein
MSSKSWPCVWKSKGYPTASFCQTLKPLLHTEKRGKNTDQSDKHQGAD